MIRSRRFHHHDGIVDGEPIASTIANMVNVLCTANAHGTERCPLATTGTAIVGISVARSFAGTGTSPGKNQRDSLQQRLTTSIIEAFVDKGGGFIRDCIPAAEEVLRQLVEAISTSFAVAISFRAGSQQRQTEPACR